MVVVACIRPAWQSGSCVSHIKRPCEGGTFSLSCQASCVMNPTDVRSGVHVIHSTIKGSVLFAAVVLRATQALLNNIYRCVIDSATTKSSIFHPTFTLKGQTDELLHKNE